MGRKRLSTGLGEEACLSGWAPGRTAWTHWGMQDASLVDGFFDAWAFRLVLGTRCRVPGTWDPVPNRRRGPEPSTGDRAKCTRRVCKIQDAGWRGWNGPWGGGFRVARSLLEVVGRSAGRGGGCAHRDCWDGGWPYAVEPACGGWVGGVYLKVVVVGLRRGRARGRRGDNSPGGETPGRYAGVWPLSWTIGAAKQIPCDLSDAEGRIPARETRPSGWLAFPAPSTRHPSEFTVPGPGISRSVATRGTGRPSEGFPGIGWPGGRPVEASSVWGSAARPPEGRREYRASPPAGLGEGHTGPPI